MKVDAALIDTRSRLYIHTPSPQAQQLYLYPYCVGDYYYLPGYCLKRESYPGYSLIYMKAGTGCFTLEGRKAVAAEGQFVLINGYRPHSYSMKEKAHVCWIHFDGVMAERFYMAIQEKKGNIISIENTHNCERLLKAVYHIFHQDHQVREAEISKYLTDILTELLAMPSDMTAAASRKIYDSISYMNQNFREVLTIEALAAQVYLSPYYYIHQFKETVGFSPHEYLLNLRISHAKYFLKNTEKKIREIADLCGFPNESSFCNTFRRRVGSTPGHYRGG